MLPLKLEHVRNMCIFIFECDCICIAVTMLLIRRRIGFQLHETFDFRLHCCRVEIIEKIVNTCCSQKQIEVS